MTHKIPLGKRIQTALGVLLGKPPLIVINPDTHRVIDVASQVADTIVAARLRAVAAMVVRHIGFNPDAAKTKSNKVVGAPSAAPLPAHYFYPRGDIPLYVPKKNAKDFTCDIHRTKYWTGQPVWPNHEIERPYYIKELLPNGIVSAVDNSGRALNIRLAALHHMARLPLKPVQIRKENAPAPDTTSLDLILKMDTSNVEKVGRIVHEHLMAANESVHGKTNFQKTEVPSESA